MGWNWWGATVGLHKAFKNIIIQHRIMDSEQQRALLWVCLKGWKPSWVKLSMHILIQDYTNKSLEMEILAENGLCALNSIKDFFFLFFPSLLWLQNVSIYSKSQSGAHLFCFIRKKLYHMSTGSSHLELHKHHELKGLS